MSNPNASGIPKYFDHRGRRVCMRQLAKETGIDIWVLYKRWHRGDRDERLTRPPAPARIPKHARQLEQRDSDDGAYYGGGYHTPPARNPDEI